MGNHMFQFASALGIARSKGMIPVITEYFPLRKIFKLVVRVVPIDSLIFDRSRIITRVEEKAAIYDKKLVNFTNSHDVRLVSYLQSYLYFDKNSSELRKQFLFKDNIQSEANKTMKRVLNRFKIISRQKVTLIGVHVRRGGYAGEN
ncbi:galactoside alpha-(1,2)-fucosyltransferase 2-like [Mytilus californianus]|uniref:galactoside alpha-(1,2)-fucosyltransferase 2-like n=1 Tax=Mytilus californianus TaxID=6549 RepID=UPI002245244D|nr:galactoside alpha-(1,2)-fucosyltransferase 2-like [Mytilus californianus]